MKDGKNLMRYLTLFALLALATSVLHGDVKPRVVMSRKCG